MDEMEIKNEFYETSIPASSRLLGRKKQKRPCPVDKNVPVVDDAKVWSVWIK